MTQPTIPEDKKECLIEQTRDGITHTPSSQMNSLKKNKDTEITMKLIFKTIEKIKC